MQTGRQRASATSLPEASLWQRERFRSGGGLGSGQNSAFSKAKRFTGRKVHWASTVHGFTPSFRRCSSTDTRQSCTRNLLPWAQRVPEIHVPRGTRSWPGTIRAELSEACLASLPASGPDCGECCTTLTARALVCSLPAEGVGPWYVHCKLKGEPLWFPPVCAVLLCCALPAPCPLCACGVRSLATSHPSGRAHGVPSLVPCVLCSTGVLSQPTVPCARVVCGS